MGGSGMGGRAGQGGEGQGRATAGGYLSGQARGWQVRAEAGRLGQSKSKVRQGMGGQDRR